MFRLRRAATSTLFPYTTLFRSVGDPGGVRRGADLARGDAAQLAAREVLLDLFLHRVGHLDAGRLDELDPYRSEEHTSELQSRRDLVCRLLLEKKKAHTYEILAP